MLYPNKMTAQIDGDFVVFLIGARVNRWWKVHKWLPVARAMPRMIKELQVHPELGLLGADGWFGRTTIMVQYWRSLDHLMAYAHGKHRQHLPAWQAFSNKIGDGGDVGIWHETFMVKAGNYECVYGGMPRFGLAAANQVEHVPAVGRLASARGRMTAREAETEQAA
ncbi:MAG: DUF4188 domain-containing protein [Deltaproteobacteria bacterium]|jgi:hypothetical protein|nr:DUF4188 domain-containing protein [Deltaproteobacteria bacterium]